MTIPTAAAIEGIVMSAALTGCWDMAVATTAGANDDITKVRQTPPPRESVIRCTASRRIPCSVAIVPEPDLEHLGGGGDDKGVDLVR
jgi:hypothetical protein